MTRARETARLIGSGTITINSTDKNIGIGSTLPVTDLNVVGIVSATSFYADGTNLTGVAVEGYNDLDNLLFS